MPPVPADPPDQLTRRAPASPGQQWRVPAPDPSAPPPTGRRTPPPSSPGRPSAREQGDGPPRRRRSWRQRTLLGGGVVVIGVLVVAIAVLAWALVKYNSVDRVGLDLADVSNAAPQNFLVVGSDTRDLS